MNIKIKILAILLFAVFLFPMHIRAQVNVKDSAVFTTMVYPAFALQWPGGDLKKRYGFSTSIGPGFMMKSENNWVFAVETGFIFGSIIRNEEQILKNISTSDGWVIDANGTYATIHLYERGFTAMAGLGKIIKGMGPNSNSGIMLMGKAGYLQHKIRIENTDNAAPQIAGDYKKGYDKLSDGPAISEFLGYMYLGNNRLVSFFGGLNCTQAWTTSRRIYDFNAMKKDDIRHFDMLIEFRGGWIIPLYKRSPKQYYYN
jgi:hypothetical protein